MISLVVPSVGRPSLQALVDALAVDLAPEVEEVVVVDDRRAPTEPLALQVPVALADRVRVLPGSARGPAAARNTGWRAARSPWIAFVDDDVLPPPGWSRALVADLAGLDARVGASQGRIEVPLPRGRRPTDWERNTEGLTRAAWATADMAYRRQALEEVGGFDERFPRAYREDADLALRTRTAGWSLVRGERHVVHPVRPADRWVSVRVQAGNADDALMRRLHGPDWRARAEAPPGRLRTHVAVTAAGLAAAALAALGRRRSAAVAGLAWLGGTAQFAWLRTAPGPRTREEVLTMVATSAAIPPVAVWHAARGRLRHRTAQQVGAA